MRAEELIVEIYRQRSELAERGLIPERVVLSAAQYKLIQDYRSRLGDLSRRDADYLDLYRVFDLEICIEEIESPRVETGNDVSASDP